MKVPIFCFVIVLLQNCFWWSRLFRTVVKRMCDIDLKPCPCRDNYELRCAFSGLILTREEWFLGSLKNYNKTSFHKSLAFKLLFNENIVTYLKQWVFWHLPSAISLTSCYGTWKAIYTPVISFWTKFGGSFPDHQRPVNLIFEKLCPAYFCFLKCLKFSITSDDFFVPWFINCPDCGWCYVLSSKQLIFQNLTHP